MSALVARHFIDSLVVVREYLVRKVDIICCQGGLAKYGESFERQRRWTCEFRNSLVPPPAPPPALKRFARVFFEIVVDDKPGPDDEIGVYES